MLRELKADGFLDPQLLFQMIKGLTKRVKKLEQEKKPTIILRDNVINISSVNNNTITSSTINAGISTYPNPNQSILESGNDFFNRKKFTNSHVLVV